MGLSVVTAPSVPAADLETLKATVVVEHNEDDALLCLQLESAIDHVQGAVDRALITQTLRYTLDRFPNRLESRGDGAGVRYNEGIRLPRAPLSSVSSITYVDEDGVTQTLASSVYVVDTTSEPGHVTLAYGQSWPCTRYQPNAVTIEYVAGYGLSPSDVPAGLRQAIVLWAANQYQNRCQGTENPPSEAFDDLIAANRVSI